MQSINRDTDAEDKLMGAKQRGKGEVNWETGIDIQTLLCMKQITNENLLYSTRNSTERSVVT